MTLVSTAMLVDADGWTIPRRMRWIADLPMYDGHSFSIHAVMATELGWVAGYQVGHDPDCAGCTPQEQAAVRDPAAGYPAGWAPTGRVDARPIVATLHRVAFYGPDLDRIAEALEAGDDFPRRQRILDKLHALREAGHGG